MNTDMKRSWSKQVEDADVNKSNNKKREYHRDFKREKLNSEEKTKRITQGEVPNELEWDPTTLQRRQKQIDYGKNTVGYHNYVNQVPIEHRSKEHPKTPDKYIKYSRRSWDMMIKLWRKELHHYDPTEQKTAGQEMSVNDINNGTYDGNSYESDTIVHGLTDNESDESNST